MDGSKTQYANKAAESEGDAERVAPVIGRLNKAEGNLEIAHLRLGDLRQRLGSVSTPQAKDAIKAMAAHIGMAPQSEVSARIGTIAEGVSALVREIEEILEALEV